MSPEILALVVAFAPAPNWGVPPVPEAALAASTGGTRRTTAGQMGADQMFVSLQITAQDLRTGFDNWFADRNDLMIANAATFASR